MTIFNRIRQVLGLQSNEVKININFIRPEIETVYPESMRFSIPTHGMSAEQAQREISSLISDYREEVFFDDKNGEILLPNTSIPYNRQIWLPNH